MSCNTRLERKLLQFSTFSSFLFAMMGIGLGLWIGSLVIVFDGAYSFVSLALTLVSLGAAAYLHSDKHQHSEAKAITIESSVIAFKGLAITVMCLVSFYSAVTAILEGGRDINTGVALIFGVINVIGCFINYKVMAVYSVKADSALVDAESKQWLMDTVISGAVMLGFTIASILMMTSYAHLAPYADPLMVVIASVYFVVVPLKMTWGAVKQLQAVKLTPASISSNS
ncbi:cobalt-zinc-cadmium resistance protein [Photobacterium jeanii]|uniref:Cobalt-zinc-cadmium resistance protein n=1 Tax=Photobacterium jeanii TaxID=858640 RepID=A0A178K8S4_9GAMM|nr:cation transporter [Photobacterium jeanii]OAN13749.1 cobalt-zinc-cadmium resistance protein [Photobacterium jeanii]PST88870.1 cation transporter [Photobacterium jeanii]